MVRHNLRAYLRHQAKRVRSPCYVPEAMLVEIFSWLPPESLIRLKCVCKSWYILITSLISNPFFVAKHLRNAQNDIFSPESLLIVGCYMASPGGTLGLDIFLLNVSNDNGFTEELDPRVPWRIGNTSYYDFGGIAESDLYDTVFYHCDGIVCMINWEKIVLWNPALLESKIIPPLNDIVDWTMVEATGFGYDPVANDYKILRIWKRDLIEIYSLNANTWKETAKGTKEVEVLGYTMEVCHKGVCYWFVKGGEKNMLLSVDLHSGQSQIVPLPARKSSSRTLEVWNDSIAFISFYEKEGSGLIELWLSKNCLGCINDSSLWIKYQSIVNLEGIRAPLRILKGDELLLNGEEDDFFSYNLHTRRLRKLIIDEVGGIRFWGLSYVKSLVSVNRRGQA